MTLPLPESSSDLLPPDGWGEAVRERYRRGERFAGLYGTDEDGSCLLTAVLVSGAEVDTVRTLVGPSHGREVHYPALTPDVPPAFWYERALHDLSGVVPDAHPRLDPLLLPRTSGSLPPRPGSRPGTAREPQDGSTTSEERQGPVDLDGHGMFTLPFGPVRSGVTESIEFLLETPGEDIPHLNIRPHYKHRGMAKQFEGRSLDDAALVAERVEGISSVAHALAFAHAAESVTGTRVPEAAALLRVVHAELERIANHLDVTMRLADAAGLAVATSRFAWHKETTMRVVSALCGNRFGRGVVTVGGVRRAPAVPPGSVCADLDRLERRLGSDLAALTASASFLDRVRGTGPLRADLARSHGALGPVGRGSGVDDDARRERPYDAYPALTPVASPRADDGDCLARARVRWEEIETSLGLVREAIDAWGALGTGGSPGDLSGRVPDAEDGFAVGWAESAQGEVMCGLETHAGVVRRCFARSASLHNLVLLHDVFDGDIFTDFPFIEASFGLGYAGVAM